METSILHLILEDTGAMTQQIMALIIIIGLLAWTIYVVASNFGSLIMEKLRAYFVISWIPKDSNFCLFYGSPPK